MCLPNHIEERVVFFLSINCPFGVKYFVATVFGIGLGKHH